jgi:hypothetical protein
MSPSRNKSSLRRGFFKTKKMKSDLTGQQFGRLKVVSLEKGMWRCQCNCGSIVYFRRTPIVNGLVKSCGCYRKEAMREQFKTHGLSKHPLIGVHNTMMSRCYNPNVKAIKPTVVLGLRWMKGGIHLKISTMMLKTGIQKAWNWTDTQITQETMRQITSGGQIGRNNREIEPTIT